jgi:hypothetical protein
MWSTAVAGAVVYRRTGATTPTLRTSTVVAVAWIVSFGLTWAARWLIAIVVLGWGDASDVIFDKVGFRVGGETGATESGFAAATRANLRYWLDDVPMTWAVLIAAAVVIAVGLFVALRRDRGAWAPFGVLAAPALLAILWYEALRNHSLIHVPKTYASCAVAVGVIVAAAVLVAVAPRVRAEEVESMEQVTP